MNVRPRSLPTAVLLAALAVATPDPARADDPAAPPAAVAAPAAPTVPVPVPAPIPAVRLAETPTAENVVAEDPALQVPAQDVAVGLARREFQPSALRDNINREAIATRMPAVERTLSVEESGSVFRHLRRRPGWRGVADLVNPMAPVPVAEPAPAVLNVVGENGPIDLRPRRNSLSDGSWVEHGLRLW